MSNPSTYKIHLLLIGFLLIWINCKKNNPDDPIDPPIDEDTTTIIQPPIDTMMVDTTTIDPPILPCDSLTFEEDPEGQWWLGDFHVHSTGASNDTGGDSWPTDIKTKAIERGLDFVVLTDHSNSTGSDPSTRDEDSTLFNLGPEFPYWQMCDSLSEQGQFLMIDGNELSPVAIDEERNNQPTGHIGCIPENLETFNPNVVFMDRPKGAVTGGEVLQQAKEAGCFTILNHPYAATTWINYDWTSYDYDAIEVWNGTIGFELWDQRGWDAWRCDLLTGRKVTAVGGSDNHRVNIEAPGSGLDPALGYPTTAVFAKEFTWPSIIQGLKDGQTMIFEGESRLQMDAYNEQYCRAEGEPIRWLRLRGKVDPLHQTATLLVHRATACEDTRPDHQAGVKITEEVILDTPLMPDQSFDIRVAIDGSKGVYTAQISHTLDGHYGALTNALIID